MNSQRGFFQNFESMELVLWQGRGTEYYYEDYQQKRNDKGEWDWFQPGKKVGQGSTYNADERSLGPSALALGRFIDVVRKVEHKRFFIPATYGVFFGLALVSIGFITRASASQ